VSQQLQFDEDAARQLEALYVIGDAVRRRGLVRGALAPAAGERVVDVGCGPGFLSAEILEEVGTGGSVAALDASEPMLELARRRCAGHANITFQAADALALPLADGEADAAVCVQVLEYVADATAALTEMCRVLRPGGRVLVWDVDWSTVSMADGGSGLTPRVLAAWDEHLAHASLPRTLRARLGEAGFADVRMAAHAFAASELDPDAYGAALMPFIAQFVTGRQGVTAEDAQAWVAEQRALDERGAFFFAATQFCFTATKAG
jgi:ubiquinone/menaquinone biosynthesis C-methylase UbiE